MNGPGRLLDHMADGVIRLDSVEVLVLDEADRMLDMGFMPDIRRILRQVPERRQTLLLSATMPAPIRELSRARTGSTSVSSTVNLSARSAPPCWPSAPPSSSSARMTSPT